MSPVIWSRKAQEATSVKPPFSGKGRLQQIRLPSQVTRRFYEALGGRDAQAVQYKPFLRFHTAHLLDEASDRDLGSRLPEILHDRQYGAFLLSAEGDGPWTEDEDFPVLLSTAVAHLVGRSNHDSMTGQFYARFSVRHEDDSDSYLRQGYRVMELHTDGTYVDEPTDWVLMMKLAEEHVTGGDSLLLHLDDWSEQERFFNHSLARKPIQWGAPVSKNIPYKLEHPVFDTDAAGRPVISYIDQFAEPRTMEEGLFLYELGEALEKAPERFQMPVPVGSMLVVNNHFWLHGRDTFEPHPDLHRELLRQRGRFVD